MALFEWTLVLLLGAVILTGLARRVGVPYPSLLAIAAAVALGAIVAPPDAAAAAAVLGRLRLPRRILHVLQGESLLNDATALVVYRIAVGVAVGAVTLRDAGPIVALMAVGSPIAGWLLARLYLLGTARVRDAASFTVLTFVGTFGVWLLAARLNLSPIITMVVYGMTLSQQASYRGNARNRVSTYSVWETAVFVLNVLAFVIMGLQARSIVSRLSRENLSHALLVSGAVLATVIVVRIAHLMAYVALGRLTRRAWERFSRDRRLTMERACSPMITNASTFSTNTAVSQTEYVLMRLRAVPRYDACCESVMP